MSRELLSLFFGIALVIIPAFCIWIKLYTTEVMFEDGPAILVIVKENPSLENRRIVTWDPSVENASRIISDENEYIGMSVYAAIVSWLWMILPFLTVIFFLGRKIWWLKKCCEPRRNN